jgi:hypothetical protein
MRCVAQSVKTLQVESDWYQSENLRPKKRWGICCVICREHTKNKLSTEARINNFVTLQAKCNCPRAVDIMISTEPKSSPKKARKMALPHVKALL